MWIRRKIRKLLVEIETELVREFPLAAQAANMVEPVYTLILCYIDTTTDEHMPFAAIIPERVRQRALERKGAEASEMIWAPRQTLPGSAALIREQALENVALQEKIESCYDLLTKDDSSDDNVTLLPFRQMMWRVARTLNEQDWQGILPVTDDFAVVASDWSGFWIEEDTANSLTPAKRRLLESRRLFFHKRSAEELAEVRRQFDAIATEMASRTKEEQIAFWINELTCLATGAPCLLAERRWNEKVALNRLRALGGDASLPLLDLAERLEVMPPLFDDQSSAAAEMLGAVFSTIEDIGYKDAAVEKRLRAMLASACATNRDRTTWSEMPFRCAHVLAKLFDYPWPSTDYNNVLIDAEAYLSAPMQAKQSS